MFPANATYVGNAIKTLSAILAMSCHHVGLVQFPAFHSQTSASAMTKHRHSLENAFLKAGLTVINPLQILYSKPDSTARDSRPLAQPSLATFHSHFGEHSFQQAQGIREGKLGPAPLLRIADFLGYDNEALKPGASARVEQIFGAFERFLGDICSL